MKTFYIFLILLSTPFIMLAQDRLADSLILVEVFNQLDGPNWNSPENWLTDAPLEEWKGIRIFDNRVVDLDIISQNPTGPFPEQIIGLDQLQTFEVRNGNMTGSIPPELVQLTQLDRFSVSGNDMSGEVPNIWTDFERLKFLILSNNNFEGPLPDIPDGMTLFYAERNNFSGPIPDSWNGVFLGNIDISDNELTGNMDVFGSWPILSRIDLSDNNWDEGPLPMWLDTLNNLNGFSCKNCNLSGSIPAGFDLRDNLVHEQIILSGNNLSGDVAALFTGPNSDKKLFISIWNNQFSGNFPSHLINKASSVDIRGNNFTSLTSFPDSVDFDGRFSIEFNKFNYEALEPLEDLIALDGDLEVRYGNMLGTLTPDTLVITEPTTITLLSGDAHPNTTYNWVGPTVQGLTEPTVEYVVDEVSNGGTFRCIMSNESFPDLSLRRNDVVIIKDFSTSTFERIDVLFKVFPNPSQDFITIDLADQTKNGKYNLIANDGQVISSGSVHNIVDIQNLTSGAYYLVVEVDGQTCSQPIIKL